MPEVFRIGQVATICRVSPHTVKKWFDSGRLKGYRIPGGSRPRRIPKEYLYKFMKQYGLEGTDKLDPRVRIIFVCQDQVLIQAMQERLDDEHFKIEPSDSAFSAGFTALSSLDFAIVDFAIGRKEALYICQAVRRNPKLRDAFIIALWPNDETQTKLDNSVANETLGKPFDPGLLAERISEITKQRHLI